MYEKVFTDINGIKQGMFLQSENPDNPVLLFLHGGPGSPEVAMDAHYKSGLEKLFTVCLWEQRGCGISFDKKIKHEELTVSRLISDTVAVTEYLKKRFGKEKIYVMGHSWGTLLGVLTVNQHPEHFHAYIGIGQVKKNSHSEYLGYKHMISEYERQGNMKMVRKFQKFDVSMDGDPDFKYLSSIRSKCLNELGIGIFRKDASMMGVIKDVFRFKGYTFAEKLKFLRGSLFSIKSLWNDIYHIDLEKEVPELNIPIYIFHGKYDYQVSYVLAKQYAKAIEAPIKGFYTFENSAHSPCFEEQEKMCEILREDVLQGKVDLADELSL